MEQWSEKLNVPLPECDKCGACCLCATPSVSYKKLLLRAANGDQFARDFFSIFIPYKNFDQARKISEEIVDITIKGCERGKNGIPLEDLVFYHCRYYNLEKKCTIYETRPQLCRDFPGNPYTTMHKDCAFYEWGKICQNKFKEMQEKLKELKKLQKEIEVLKENNKYEELNEKLKNLQDEDYRFMLTVPDMCVVSPGASWLKE